MAVRKNGGVAAEKAGLPEPEEKTADVQRYPVGRLRQDCLQLLGVTGSTFDGVAKGLDGDYTVEEMKNMITAWLEAPAAVQGRK